MNRNSTLQENGFIADPSTIPATSTGIQIPFFTVFHQYNSGSGRAGSFKCIANGDGLLASSIVINTIESK